LGHIAMSLRRVPFQLYFKGEINIGGSSGSA
jgi:hypothetical protein